MKRICLILLVFSLCFFLSNVTALEPTRRCLNSTHLETVIKWSESGANQNITQISNCTMPTDSSDRCDKTNNLCRYIERNETGNLVVFGSVTFVTCMFFILGMKVQPGKEFGKLKNGMQLLFFFMGFWMLILQVGMAETIAVSSGVSENTFNLIQQTVTLMSRVIYVVMFLLFLSYLISVLYLFKESVGK